MQYLFCKRNFYFKFFFICKLFLFVSIYSFAQKTIAITIDDLPSALPKISLMHSVEINNKLIAELDKKKVPVIGFVNEFMVAVDGEEEERTEMLRKWVSKGLELGNHTYSHTGFTTGNFHKYENEIRKGEIITNKVLGEKGKKVRYFRPPFLKIGSTVPEKEKLNLFLADMNYTLAPATIESSDFVFNLIYLKAKVQDDTATMRSIAKEYLDFTLNRLKFYEEVSEKTAGEIIPQIFLCHANDINADHMAELLHLFTNEGYRFISLDKALEHPFYHEADDYIGNEGISWLLRHSNVEDREVFFKIMPKVKPKIRKEYEAVQDNQFIFLLEERIKGASVRVWLLFAFLGFIILLVFFFRVLFQKLNSKLNFYSKFLVIYINEFETGMNTNLINLKNKSIL